MSHPPRRSVFHVIPGQPQPGQVVSASPLRVGLTFFPPTGGNAVINLKAPASSTDGLNLSSNGTPYELTIEEHGDIVQQAWFAFINPNTGTMGVLETLKS